MTALNVFFRTVVIVFCAALLSQCNKASQGKPREAEPTPFRMSAQAYLAMANNQGNEEQQRMNLLAAGRLLEDGQWKEARRLLRKQTTSDPLLRSEAKILLAKAEYMAKRPQQALKSLSSVQNLSELQHYYQREYHRVLADCYDAQKLAVESVQERVKLDDYLSSSGEKIHNRRKLWLTLSQMPRAELDTQAVELEEGNPLNGWMQLASIARQPGAPERMVDSVQQWRLQNPRHPANSILPPSLNGLRPWMFAPPQRVAMLLPLSGPLAGPGQAVIDGFKEGRREDNYGSIRVLAYDTNQGDAAELYRRAIEDGAQYVVGPLGKKDVARVASLEHPVPTLLLNDAEKPLHENAYQFGLSPANEARQLALKAASDGYRHALVIAPAGTWGDEVRAAFADQWQRAGGQEVESLLYERDTKLNDAVRSFLHVKDSQDRVQLLKKVLGKDITAVPRRRKDFDMVFLLSYPSKARQIMPLLRYYYAENVPVYGISTVYAGVPDTKKNRDLDGIIFCDMPWVFQSEQLVRKNWPETLNSYNRLFALGMDSYALARQLNQLLLFPALGVGDSSGILYLTRSQRIGRILTWGQFKNGEAVIL